MAATAPLPSLTVGPPQPTPSGAIQFALVNSNPTRGGTVITAPAGTLASWPQMLPPGFLPPYHWLRVTHNGTTVPCQQSRPSSRLYADGSANHVQLAIRTPSELPPDGRLDLTIDTVPTGTMGGGITIHELAEAQEVLWSCTGHDAGDATWDVSLQDVLKAGLEGPWGDSHPLAGWETLATGPVVNKWRLIRFPRRRGTDETHPYARLTVYITLVGDDPTGHVTTEAHLELGNCYGAMGAAPGTNLNARFYANWTVAIGGKVVGHIGGPEDPRTAGSTIAFDTAANTVTVDGPARDWLPGVGCALRPAADATLPPWLDRHRVYFVGGAGQGGTLGTSPVPLQVHWNRYGLANCPSPAPAYAASTYYNSTIGQYSFVSNHGQVFGCTASGTTPPDGGGPAGNSERITDGATVTWQTVVAAFGPGGGGTVYLDPVPGCEASYGCNLCDIDGGPFWSGCGELVQLAPVHDIAMLGDPDHPLYCAAIHPYAPGFEMKPELAPALIPYHYGGMGYLGGYWYTQTTGGAEWRGWMPQNGVCALLAPTIPGYYRWAVHAALSLTALNYHFNDERSGKPVVNNGTTYRGLAPGQPSCVMETGDGSVPAVGVVISTTVDYNGMGAQGSIPSIPLGQHGMLDTTHVSIPSIAAYLLTGRDVFLDQAIGFACGSLVSYLYRNWRAPAWYSGLWYGNPQVRGAGWALEIDAQAAWYVTDDDPLQPYLHDSERDIVGSFNDYWPSQYPYENLNRFGFWNGTQNGPWQSAWLYCTVARQVARHRLTGNEPLRAAWDTMRRYLKGLVRLVDPAAEGCDYYAPMYYWHACTVDNDYSTATLSTPAEIIDNTLQKDWGTSYAGCPADGLHNQDGPLAPNDYAAFQICHGVWSVKLGDAGAAEWLAGYCARVAGEGGVAWHAGQANNPGFCFQYP